MSNQYVTNTVNDDDLADEALDARHGGKLCSCQPSAKCRADRP